MKNLECLNNTIEKLDFDNTLITKLKSLNIYKIEDLWKCNRNYLKSNDFTNADIAQIKIRLQLIGLDINKKIY